MKTLLALAIVFLELANLPTAYAVAHDYNNWKFTIGAEKPSLPPATEDEASASRFNNEADKKTCDLLHELDVKLKNEKATEHTLHEIIKRFYDGIGPPGSPQVVMNMNMRETKDAEVSITRSGKTYTFLVSKRSGRYEVETSSIKDCF